MRPAFDARDEEIKKQCVKLLDAKPGVRVGDFVRFSCGTLRRVSYIWDWEGAEDPSVQTSCEGGGYYLAFGYVSFSGSLYRSVPRSSLTLTEEKRDGRVWFFHHDFAQAHNGVETTVPFRVFTCNLPAPEV